MKCPKCGYERMKQDDEHTPKTDCPSCGVIYAKAEAALLKQKAAKQRQKEEELNKREEELKKREKALKGESPQLPKDPIKKPKIIGSFTRYFAFIFIGLPGLIIMLSGIEEGVSDNWISIIIGGSIFIFLLYHLPPIKNIIKNIKQANQVEVEKSKEKAEKLKKDPEKNKAEVKKNLKDMTVQEFTGLVVGLGIIGAVVFFCFTFLKTCFGPTPVDIKNGIAEREIIVSPLYTVGVVADSINSHTCNIIEDYPNIKGVEIFVWMDGESVSDKYGNKMSENLYMGSVEENDLEEVKKYKSCSDYSYAMKSETMAKVLAMGHAQLLRK